MTARVVRRICTGAALGGLAGLLPGAAAWSLPAMGAVELAPHRAVYDMQLDSAATGSNIAHVRGRLVFDFTGSSCEGYTLNTRLVTEIIDREGRSVLADMRSSSWEDGGSETFRFNSSQYLNKQLSEAVAGNASRNGGQSITVTLDRPANAELQLPNTTMFPTQHSLAILDAARRGQSIVQAELFDGSEKGEKVYETTTIIGKSLEPGANKTFKPVENADALDGLVSWPVSISYFDPKPSDEGLPSYQLAFRLYANGVSRKLHIDYGHFSVAGELSRIEFYPADRCPPTQEPRTGP